MSLETHFLEIESITFGHGLKPEQRHFGETLTCIICYLAEQKSQTPADPQKRFNSRMTRFRRPSPSLHRTQASETVLSQPFILHSASETTRERDLRRHLLRFALSETLSGFKPAQKSWIQHYGGELQDGGLKLRTCSLRNSLLILFLIPPVCTLLILLSLSLYL